jgi:osmotically-inducible protein OsmY
MNDKELKQDVQNALDWEPGLDAKNVGVSVEAGVVTMHGNVITRSTPLPGPFAT